MYAVRFGIDSVVGWQSKKMAAENKMENSWSQSGAPVVPKYKSSLRFDVVYKSMPVRRFTKENLFRILYSDSEGDLVCGNALKLMYSGSCHEEILLEEGGYTCEIIYIYIDQNTGHTINRSQVLLEKLAGFDDSYIRSENVLWRIRVQHIDEMIKLYSYFADQNESVTLTHLRKIASNKKISKNVQLRIDSESRSPDASSSSRSSELSEHRVEEVTEVHQLSVEIWSKTVLLTHKCFDLADNNRIIFEEFLLKYDITSFLDFLRITKQVIRLENDNFQLNFGSPVLENNDFWKMDQKHQDDYFRLAKLSSLSEKLSGISKQKRRVCERKKKKHNADHDVEPKSLKKFDENGELCSNPNVRGDASLFEQLTELFDEKFEN